MAMKESFKNYCAAIGMSEVAQERVERVITELTSLYDNMQFDDIFINDMFRNGERTFASIWLFNEKYIVECKEFMTDDDYDLAIFDKTVQYFNIRKKDYSDLENPTEKSNITIDATFGYNAGLTCSFMANGKNCKYALNVAKKYFISKLLK